ncbi:protein scabrous isoform X2 [Chironomus tepperi]
MTHDTNNIDKNNNNINRNNDNNQNGYEQMPVNDQISLLSKRLEILTEHRQEDYRLLERSLHTFVQKHLHEYINVDIKKELKDLRAEIKILRQGVSPNQEKLTTWLSSSISELRTEIAELQQSASNLSKTCHQRNLFADDLKSIRDEIKTFKLEINAIKSRQERSDVLLRELREEITENSKDLWKSYEERRKKIESSSSSLDYVRSDAEHKLRHYRLLRAQVQELESAQRLLQQRMIEIENEKLIERLQNIEEKQKELENSNFNLSREISSFESSSKKSTLELLEDIADIETKIDHTIPEIRREITKVEIDSAQISSNQNILKEEDHNMARTIQALAVSISTLQNERSRQHNLDTELNRVKVEIEKLRASVGLRSLGKDKNLSTHETQRASDSNKKNNDKIDTTVKLVKELEYVEKQYHNIIEALPSGCHEIETSDNDLHMIAPADYPHPTLVKCIGPWTVIQKRHDGSVDFNRSWEEYAKGFGDPNDELWIGNEMLHQLTKDNCTKLRIVIQDIGNKTLYADYDSFYIATRSEGYRIDLAGYSGNASNALDYQNHMKFSSIDVDLDISHDHCAGEYEGGWWFSYCSHGNLNGRYNSGVTWYDLSNNEWMAVKTTLMMITKRQECLNENNEESYISSIDLNDSGSQTI